MDQGATVEGATPSAEQAASLTPAVETVASETAPASSVAAATPESPPDTPATTPPDAGAAPSEPVPAAEAKPAVEGAAAAEAPAATEAEPPKPEIPTYAEFNLPDGFKAEQAIISAASNIFGKYGLPQDGAQELVDFHANQVKQAIAAEAQRQVDVFGDTRKGWLKQIDKEFGNRRDTVVNDARWAISQFAGSKTNAKELTEMLTFTGAGDHPAMVRLLANVAKKLREREAPSQALSQRSAQNVPAWERRYAQG